MQSAAPTNIMWPAWQGCSELSKVLRLEPKHQLYPFVISPQSQENHHVSAAFTLMHEDPYAFMPAMPKQVSWYTGAQRCSGPIFGCGAQGTLPLSLPTPAVTHQAHH